MSFIGHQSTHMIPVKRVDRWRVRTGYERVIAQYAGRNYAGVAEQDGKVTDIDPSTQLCTIKYKDGSIDKFKYGETYSEHESVMTTHNLVLIVKVGQQVKKGDVITYNEHYFYRDPMTNQVDFCIGVKAKVALLENDVSLEDATEISSRLSDAMSITPTNTRVVTLPADAIVHKCAQVGDEVTITDDLVVFENTEGMDIEESFNRVDDETLALISDLNRKTPTAKFSGVITKIEAYYGCPISEMSPTLQPIVRKAAAEQNKLYKAVQGTTREDDYAPSEPMPKYCKFKGVEFDSNTVMLIFYIQEHQAMNTGDKQVFGNQLKHTISKVMSRPMFTEEGEEIDAVFSAEAVSRRICMSPTLMGMSSQIMEKIEKNVLDIYFGDKKKKE